MSGVAVGVGVVGAGASLSSANKAAKSAKSALGSQERMSAADLAFRQKQYDRYLGLMGPIEEKLAQEAQSSQPLDYDKVAAQIKTNTANAGRSLTGMMASRGIAGGGTDVGGMRGLAFQQASGLTGAYEKGLEDRRKLGLDLTGRGQIERAAQGVSGGMLGMANLYGSQANLYNQAAAQGWGNFGANLGNVAIGANDWINRPQSPAVLPGLTQSPNAVIGAPPTPPPNLWQTPVMPYGLPANLSGA